MVTTTRHLERKVRQLIKQLLAETPETKRCPHLRVDSTGPYCSKNYKKNTPITDQRRGLCDSASLQFWCLDESRTPKCIYYQGEPID